MSVTKGIYPCPDTYIDKYRIGVLQLVLSSLNFKDFDDCMSNVGKDSFVDCSKKFAWDVSPPRLFLHAHLPSLKNVSLCNCSLDCRHQDK